MVLKTRDLLVLGRLAPASVSVSLSPTTTTILLDIFICWTVGLHDRGLDTPSSLRRQRRLSLSFDLVVLVVELYRPTLDATSDK